MRPLRGPARALRRQVKDLRAALGRAGAAPAPAPTGEQADDPFSFAVEPVKVRSGLRPLRSSRLRIHVPPPSVHHGSLTVTAGRRTYLPFRDFEPAGTSDHLIYGDLKTYAELRGGDGPVTIAYTGYYERYDLVTADKRSGELHLALGEERALEPEEFAPPVPEGHVSVCAVYTTRDGCEVIDRAGWHDLLRVRERRSHAAWLRYCRARLPRTMGKLRTGQAIRLAGYGDSTTALGGRLPIHAAHPNGEDRDTTNYLECYGADWIERLVAANSPDEKNGLGHRLGWNWFLKQAIEDRSGCSVTYENWGVAGTNSNADSKSIDGFDYPNCSNPRRLSVMLASRPDLVTIAIGVNDIGERIDTRANIVAIGKRIRDAGADLIVIGPCRPNPRFEVYRQDWMWKATHDEVMAAARDLDAAFLDLSLLFDDGNEGAIGISRRSHGAASMGNHPGARELAAVGHYLAKLIP